ncbi:MAG: Gfo/Idh/MocA family oxidoreductase [Candidatus Sumerlaeia bacterium]|nr:Gfo/Idh/MocA family oxidoreductase [Candidatus Sumerlaeia bacterium]
MDKSRNLSRRGFLKTAGAVMAAGPAIITAPIRATAGRAAPNDRIVMGFIGPGKQGLGHIRRFVRFPDVQVVAVSDVDTSRREWAKKTVEEHYGKEKAAAYKGCAAYKDFRELLARDDINAVLIATPDHWHAIPAIMAAQAKKDIYCEKPLSLTIHEARQMANAVRKNNVVFQTGSQQRSEFNGYFIKAVEYVRSGRIGKIKTVHVGCGGPSEECKLPEEPVPDGLDWDFWLGPAPFRPYNKILCPAGIPTQPPKELGDIPWYNNFPNWRRYRDYSGGGMTDFGAHHFDIAQWGLNMDHSGPTEIYPPDGKEFKTLTYKYANGVVMYHGGANSVKFTGEHGVIECSRKHVASQPESILKEPLGPNDVHLNPNMTHAENWLDCIRTRKRPIADVEIGCRTVTVCHLGNLAYWHKRPLKWDPEKERFIGDEEANTWLDRPKRAPWKLPEV